MSFPRYPRYKDSGVDWLGEVPEHWELTRLKHLARFAGGGTPSRDVPEFWNGDIPWVSPKDMKSEAISGSEEQVTELGLESGASSLIPEGRLLMVTRSGILRHTIPVAVNAIPVALNQDMKALSFHDGLLSSTFFLRWVQGLNNQLLLAWGKQGATVESIEHEYLANTRIAWPDGAERAAIVTFLERESSKIDALIAEQQRLIKLLKEKRQAVISHAVTRGLNPDALMKPSGVEWLGDVPAHWEVTPLKRHITYLTSGSRGWAEYYSNDGELFLRIGNLTRDSLNLDLDDIQRVNVPVGSEGERTRVRPDDLLFSITAYLGSVAVVPADLEPAYVSQHVALTRLRGQSLDAKWVGNVALSSIGQTWFQMQSYGGTKIQLSLDDVRDLPITVPPLHEQRRILAHIETQIAQMEALTADAERAIALLQERRTALISAAVTGKMDVRGIVHAEAA